MGRGEIDGKRAGRGVRSLQKGEGRLKRDKLKHREERGLKEKQGDQED